MKSKGWLLGICMFVFLALLIGNTNAVIQKENATYLNYSTDKAILAYYSGGSNYNASVIGFYLTNLTNKTLNNPVKNATLRLHVLHKYESTSISISYSANSTWSTPSASEFINSNGFANWSSAYNFLPNASYKVGDYKYIDLTDIINNNQDFLTLGFCITVACVSASLDTVITGSPLSASHGGGAVFDNLFQSLTVVPLLEITIGEIIPFNIIYPLDNSYYTTTENIYFNFINKTENSANVSYNIDGGSFTDIATNAFSGNISLGTFSTGVYQLGFNFTYGTTQNIYYRTVNIGTLIGSCGTYNKNILNFTFFDEENSTKDLNVTYQAVLFTDLESYNYSTSGTNNILQICTTENNTNFLTNVIIQYENETGYQARDYFGVYNITGNFTEQKLYLLNETKNTNLEVSVSDQNDIELSDYYVEAYRYDVATNSFRLVDSGLTDVNGITSVDIDISNVLYKFIIRSKQNEIIFITSVNQVNDNPFSVKVPLNIDKTVKILNELQNSVLYYHNVDETLKLISISYNDINGLVSQACFKVENISGMGYKEELNYNCSIVSNYSMIYNYTENNNTNLIYSLTFKSVEDNNDYEVIVDSVQNIKKYLEYGDDAWFYGMLIVIFLFLIGAKFADINASLIMGLLGLWATYFIGFVVFKISTMIGITFAIIIALYLINKTK